MSRPLLSPGTTGTLIPGFFEEGNLCRTDNIAQRNTTEFQCASGTFGAMRVEQTHDCGNERVESPPADSGSPVAPATNHRRRTLSGNPNAESPGTVGL